MSKILELADAYAQAKYSYAHVPSIPDEARAALVSEVERMEAAHQQELAQVKADLKSCQAKNREMLGEIAALREDAARMDWLESSKESHAFCHTYNGDYLYYAHQTEGYKTVRQVIDEAEGASNEPES